MILICLALTCCSGDPQTNDHWDFSKPIAQKVSELEKQIAHLEARLDGFEGLNETRHMKLKSQIERLEKEMDATNLRCQCQKTIPKNPATTTAFTPKGYDPPPAGYHYQLKQKQLGRECINGHCFPLYQRWYELVRD